MAKPTKKRNKKTVIRALNKIEMSEVLSEKTGLSPVQVRSVIDAIADYAHENLRTTGSEMLISGVAKFVVKWQPARPARMGWNPHQNAPMEIPAQAARNVVRVRVSKRLNDAVSGVVADAS